MQISTNLKVSDQPAESVQSPPFHEYCQWHAVRTRPRWEKIVAQGVASKGYEGFLPLYRKRSQWSDRVKQIDLPLFPGYVFVRGNYSGRPRVITTPGVIGVLSFGGVPAIITDDEMENIKAVTGSGLHAEPWPYLHEGQRVRINAGALTGTEGILIRNKSDCRVVLSVEALFRSIAVEIDRDWVTPCRPL